LAFLCALAEWQNTILEDASDYILRLYSLKSILPRGSGIWQNGKILFEKACQTASNSQILLRFNPLEPLRRGNLARWSFFKPKAFNGFGLASCHRWQLFGKMVRQNAAIGVSGSCDARNGVSDSWFPNRSLGTRHRPTDREPCGRPGTTSYFFGPSFQ
jgi:hypothetical protein